MILIILFWAYDDGIWPLRSSSFGVASAFVISSRGATTSSTSVSFWNLHATIDRSSSNSASVGQNKKKKTKIGTKKKLRIKKNHKKKHNNNGQFQRQRQSLPPNERPLVTIYEDQISSTINQQRLHEDKINCEHFENCSGCIVQEKVGTNIDTIQSAKSFFQSPWIQSKMIIPKPNFYNVIIPSALIGWRTQAKLVVAPSDGNGSGSNVWSKNGCTLGLYKSKSHIIEPIPNCQVHHPAINVAARIIEQATTNVGISSYQEHNREGQLRYVQFQVERTTQKICLTLIWNAETIKQAQPALSRLVKELHKLAPTDQFWHSIWCNCNTNIGNTIVSRHPKHWHHLYGPEFLREPIPTGQYGYLYFTPLTFRQGNMDGFDIIATDVARLVPAGSKVCELYAGVGLLGLTALAYQHDNSSSGNGLRWLRCSDENPNNVRSFKRSLGSL